MDEKYKNYYLDQEVSLLKDFDHMVKRVKGTIIERYGKKRTDDMLVMAREEYRNLIPKLPYVGDMGMFKQFVISTGWYLAFYRAMQAWSISIHESGLLFFEFTRNYVEHVPGLVRRYLGVQMFTERFQRKAREKAIESQERPLPEGYICKYVEGDGITFDFGVDYLRCATLEFLRRQGAEELAPYTCALDYISSEFLGWGLTRTTTLAEGGDVCDFRFKKGGPTRIASSVIDFTKIGYTKDAKTQA
jgi:hypothetical protein